MILLKISKWNVDQIYNMAFIALQQTNQSPQNTSHSYSELSVSLSDHVSSITLLTCPCQHIAWRRPPLRMKSKSLVENRYLINSSAKFHSSQLMHVMMLRQNRLGNTMLLFELRSDNLMKPTYVRYLIEFLQKWYGVCISPDPYFLCEGAGSTRLISIISAQYEVVIIKTHTQVDYITSETVSNKTFLYVAWEIQQTTNQFIFHTSMVNFNLLDMIICHTLSLLCCSW